MNVSIFSFVVSALFGTVFLLAIHFLCCRTWFVRKFGAHTVLALYALCLVRFILATELPFTRRVGMQGGYSRAYMKALGTQRYIAHQEVSLMDMLCYGWLIVAVVLVARMIWKNRKVSRKLARCARICPHAEQVCGDIERGSRFRFPISVWVCPNLDIPVGMGLFRKRIYLPDEAYTEEERFYILKHEYTHFTSWDIEIKYLVQLFCCVFWWNPAVYLLKKDIEKILEMRCDRNATRQFSKKERLAYLRTIVRLLGEREKPGLAGISTSTALFRPNRKKDIRERFALLTQPQIPLGRWIKSVVMGVSLLVLVLSYTFVLRPTQNIPSEDFYRYKFCGVFEVIRVEKLWDNISWIAVSDTGYVFSIKESSAQACVEKGVPLYINKLKTYEEEQP